MWDFLFRWLLDHLADAALGLLVGALVYAYADRRRYKQAMERLRLQNQQSLIQVEQVLVQKFEGKLCLLFRDLPGHTQAETLFHDLNVVRYLQSAAKGRSIKHPVLELADAGWPAALRQLFSYVRSRCASLNGPKLKWVYLIPTCWSRNGDRSMIRIYVVPPAVLDLFTDDSYWPQLYVEEVHHGARILALRQIALHVRGRLSTKGPRVDAVKAQLRISIDWEPNRDNIQPVDWSTLLDALQEVNAPIPVLPSAEVANCS